ncbi:hypothetical protein N7466_006991 [Penicillium verhagenii]|uniref:uncharacterized protein n=1 Tax=Penicillium verhagenii TaxID=1562060 RepID=UPI0025456FF8|nr:uncharacterized protein N7466_006991 [Penicillium verhagenii]KAJ5928035.1 hypothetical protein N7466_006991 [Penicillium verhagenii]
MARGAKAREYDYSAVGTQGRRTGITLKEGKRDEHGMEEVDGLFSSPEKSPAKVNGFDDRDSEDSIGSDGMSIDEGNAPGPMDFLNATNASRNALLPPPGRSPAKGISSSARISPDLRSTPDQEDESLSPSPSDGKGLTKTNGSRQEASPLTARSVNAGVSKPRHNGPKATKAQLVAPESPIVHDFSDGDENANSFLPEDNDFGDSFDAGDETVMPEDDVPEPPVQDHSDADNDSPPAEASPVAPKKPTTTSKQRKQAPAAKDTDSKTKKNGTQSGRRGRPPKSSRPLDEEAVPEARSPKRQKVTKSQSQVIREPLDPELNKVVENYTQRSGPLKGRSLYILKRENPTDQSSTHTRSGRASIRPLAYWRNERCVYGDGEAEDGQRFPLSTIKEVVRAEELEPERGRTKKGKRAGRKSKSKAQAEESSGDDDDLDVWEKESGVLHGFIPRWDPKSQNSTKEEDVIVSADIAYAPSGIETREVKDSTFRFAKLLSSSFIGSGVVELPPEGVKRPKNSKKMHMVFYVCHGRVQVDISGVQFSAGKGCVFQVPRGNYYSFQNAHSKEARLFFTQGCVPGEDEIALSKSRNAVQESEFEAEGEGELEGDDAGEDADEAEAEAEADAETETENVPAPVIKKSRGRPKGKQKAK